MKTVFSNTFTFSQTEFIRLEVLWSDKMKQQCNFSDEKLF